jgi:hypothetical protein
MTVILMPTFIIVVAAHVVAAPGPTESEVLRWIGVAIAVAGTILATPDGIASAWHFTKRWNRKMSVLGRRLLRRPKKIVGFGGVVLGKSKLGGSVFAHKWQPWLPRADADLKIDILHKQVDILQQEIAKLDAKIDQSGSDLRKEIQAAEERVLGQMRQLESEFRGERTTSSRVNARGLGPVALGIILTGLPDELADFAPGGWLGWLAVGVGVLWVICVSPSWLRDYRQALEDKD